MGTRGYYVYRYRNKYFAYYINWDCYPPGLGVSTIKTMRLPNSITEKREELESLLDERKGIPSEKSVDNLTISSRRPQNNLLIEWIYEIDLDRNIFHINGIPFFDLECLPDEEAFLEYVPDSCSGGHPDYRNIARKMQCPPEHKYKMPGPPIVDDSDLATYQSSVCTGSHVALSDLLVISDVLSPDEQVRVSLLETMIGQCMIVYSELSQIGYDPPWIGHVLYDFEILSNHNQITDEEWLGACSMANFAFVPQLFDSSRIIHRSLSRKEFTWVREDTVVYIATHLDDERCLLASISCLITTILEQKDVPGDYFGVAFSIYHCAIVKVVKDRDTTTFSHTAALQFLPSFSSDSPSTPGITALARLGHRMDPALFVRAMEVCSWLVSTMDKENSLSLPKVNCAALPSELLQGNDAPSNVNCAALPSELWQEIALHLDLTDVLALGMISKLCREAASMVLHYPHICGRRLVAVSNKTPKCLLQHHRFLYAASFSAALAGVPTIVIVGWGNDPELYLTLDCLRVCVSGTGRPSTMQYPFNIFADKEEVGEDDDDDDYDDDDDSDDDDDDYDDDDEDEE